MTPENRNAFNAVLDELKRAISQSIGQDHESVQVIEQIESTLRHIEAKAHIDSVTTDSFVVSPATLTTTIA
jgi:hypothetical protein